MKQNYTEILFILDASGSMADERSEAIQGLNNFIAAQKNLPGECKMTLVQFNSRYYFIDSPSWYRVIRNAVPIEEISPITKEDYIPNGGTALLDAIGTGIDQLGARLAQLPESERPDKVLVAVLTDGNENSSFVFSADKIKEMIKHQTDVYSWTFTFLSSDIKAVNYARTLGYVGANVRYSKSISAAMNTYSKAGASYRVASAAGPAENFFEEDEAQP